MAHANYPRRKMVARRSAGLARTSHIVSIDQEDIHAHPDERTTQLLFGSFGDQGAATNVVYTSKVGPDSIENHSFHVHGFEQIIYVLSGELMAQAEGEAPYAMVAGDMAQWPPGVLHRNWVETTEACYHLSISISR
jgi:glyoxylate utilization-related uncharacterized protein